MHVPSLVKHPRYSSPAVCTALACCLNGRIPGGAGCLELHGSYQSGELQQGYQREDKEFYLAHNYTIRVSVSTQSRSQRCIQNFCGPFLRAVLLTAVDMNSGLA